MHGTYRCVEYIFIVKSCGIVENLKVAVAEWINMLTLLLHCHCEAEAHLRSATQQLLVILCHQLSCYGRWPFCVAGPSVWNSLLDRWRNLIIGRNSFRQFLKMFLFATYWCI